MRKNWLLRRVLASLAVLAAVLALNFVLFRVMPGDAVSTIVDPNFSPQAKERLRELYGLEPGFPKHHTRSSSLTQLSGLAKRGVTPIAL